MASRNVANAVPWPCVPLASQWAHASQPAATHNCATRAALRPPCVPTLLAAFPTCTGRRAAEHQGCPGHWRLGGRGYCGRCQVRGSGAHLVLKRPFVASCPCCHGAACVLAVVAVHQSVRALQLLLTCLLTCLPGHLPAAPSSHPACPPAHSVAPLLIAARHFPGRRPDAALWPPGRHWH